jgi:plasmid stabilization system protein ParE
MKRAFLMLCADPKRSGVQQFEDMPGRYLFHLRHARTRGTPPKQPRHFIVFTYDETHLTVLRILHDSMEIERQVGDDEAEA